MNYRYSPGSAISPNPRMLHSDHGLFGVGSNDGTSTFIGRSRPYATTTITLSPLKKKGEMNTKNTSQQSRRTRRITPGVIEFNLIAFISMNTQLTPIILLSTQLLVTNHAPMIHPASTVPRNDYRFRDSPQSLWHIGLAQQLYFYLSPSILDTSRTSTSGVGAKNVTYNPLRRSPYSYPIKNPRETMNTPMITSSAYPETYLTTQYIPMIPPQMNMKYISALHGLTFAISSSSEVIPLRNPSLPYYAARQTTVTARAHTATNDHAELTFFTWPCPWHYFEYSNTSESFMYGSQLDLQSPLAELL